MKELLQDIDEAITNYHKLIGELQLNLEALTALAEDSSLTPDQLYLAVNEWKTQQDDTVTGMALEEMTLDRCTCAMLDVLESANPDHQ